MGTAFFITSLAAESFVPFGATKGSSGALLRAEIGSQDLLLLVRVLIMNCVFCPGSGLEKLLQVLVIGLYWQVSSLTRSTALSGTPATAISYNPGSTTNLAFATIKKIDEPGCNVYGLKWATKLPPFFMRKYL